MSKLNINSCDWFLYDSIVDRYRVNPYSPNVTFLYHLRFSDVFRGYRNVTLGEYGLSCTVMMIFNPFISRVQSYRNQSFCKSTNWFPLDGKIEIKLIKH